MSFPRYGETKLMNILFTRELARRLEGTGVTANCVHPGAVATNIGAPGRLVSAVTKVILKSPEQGARTSLDAGDRRRSSPRTPAATSPARSRRTRS